MAVTKQQVKIYMTQREEGEAQPVAAAKAGLCERTGRRIEQSKVTRDQGPRQWRTRNDPFDAVWPELADQLNDTPQLQAVTLLEWLQERYPGQYPDKLLRTLQRRLKNWRARYGPDKEVMFPQTHGPGVRGLSDFTQLKGVVVTIRGEVLDHRLYHFRLAHSGWSYARVVLGGESYSALAQGLTEALEHLGGVPAEHRTDSLSAAFKNLAPDEQADITERYDALCAHYGMRASRNNPGRGHENASVEAAHGHFKRRLKERLALRGSHDFESLDAYRAFIEEVVASVNRRNSPRIAAERAELAPLPCQRGVDYTETVVRVTSSSTFSFARELYSVPPRLIGERLRVHIYDEQLVLHHGGRELMRLTRVRATKHTGRRRSIDYRHLIDWLARKPRALAGLSFRDDLLPSPAWRAIYQRLNDQLASADACKRVVAALKLAAEQDCAEALGDYWLDRLNQGESPTLVALQHQFSAGETRAAVPELSATQHALSDYDVLLGEEVSDD